MDDRTQTDVVSEALVDHIANGKRKAERYLNGKSRSALKDFSFLSERFASKM